MDIMQLLTTAIRQLECLMQDLANLTFIIFQCLSNITSRDLIYSIFPLVTAAWHAKGNTPGKALLGFGVSGLFSLATMAIVSQCRLTGLTENSMDHEKWK